MNKFKHEFIQTVWGYYNANARNMPWREDTNPYYVWISEMMLQQTQVERVIPKFNAFISLFPDVHTLSNAGLEDVLRVWKGLGYNRRAKFVLDVSRIICKQYDGSFPKDIEKLVELPGVGKNTAGAVLVYAHNLPVIFIETNIRTVFMHHFFKESDSVSDTEILSIVKETLDQENPREWYWALMDYGSYLKKTIKNNHKSNSYVKQKPFKGSTRELRGKVLEELLHDNKTYKELQDALHDTRLEQVLEALQKEQIITKHVKRFSIV